MTKSALHLTEYNLFRNLIVGNRFIPSWTLYKRVLLTGQVALFAIIYTMVNIILGVAENITEFVPLYLAVAVSCASVILVLRSGYYTAGRILLVITSMIMVSIFSLVDRSDTSVYFFYFVIIIGSLTVFGFDQIMLGLVFASLAVITFVVIFFGDYKLADPLDLSDAFAKRTFALNFIMAVLLCVLMVYYIILINYRMIQSLTEKEEDLLKLTDELSNSRKRFELAIHGSSAGIWDWDPKTDSLYLSPLLAQILGYSSEDLDSANQDMFFQAIHPDDLQQVQEKFEYHLAEQENFEVEFRIRNKQGDYIWVLDTGQAQWDEEGNPTRMVGSIIDISERKLAEEQVLEKNKQLEKANKELDRFVYSVSHDLKSPLSSVLGLISITEMTDDMEEIRKCINMMRTRINQLNKFIEEIIEYARNTRKEIHHNDKVVIRDMVNNILEDLAYLEHRDQIEIINHVSENCVISTDESRLKIILSNLIGNAIKYHNISKPNPYIEIKLEECDDQLKISVEDNGFGIDQEHAEKIFEMFFRASEHSDGSGLGLYIAREMAQNLGGTISVESKKDYGTTFTLTIPVTNSTPE